jgi:SAM-dependent methyltransferase
MPPFGHPSVADAATPRFLNGWRSRLGLYSRHIFPRLCDWVMSDPRMAKLRSELLADVGGEVLEIGFGTGLNLAHYPEHVRRITTVDPNPGMGRLARRRVAEGGIAVDHRTLGGEELPFGDVTFDVVVSTWTLCSIPEVGRALAEVYRVLKPGGRFVFLEHGQGGDPGVRRWQRRLNPIQRVLGDGCRLDLDVEAVVRSQPFRDVAVERFEMERVPRIVGTMYRGFGVR